MREGYPGRFLDPSNGLSGKTSGKSAVVVPLQPLIPLITALITRFFSRQTIKNEQATGLYVLGGLYLHDLYYMSTYVFDRRNRLWRVLLQLRAGDFRMDGF